MCNSALVAHRGCGHLDIVLTGICETRNQDRERNKPESACDDKTRIAPVISEARCRACRHPEEVNRFLGIDSDLGYALLKEKMENSATARLLLSDGASKDDEGGFKRPSHPGRRRQSPERSRDDRSRSRNGEERERSESRGRRSNRRAGATGRYERSKSQQSRLRSGHSTPRASGQVIDGNDELPVPSPSNWITDEWLKTGWKTELALIKVLEERLTNLKPHCLLLPYSVFLHNKMRSLRYIEAFMKK